MTSTSGFSSKVSRHAATILGLMSQRMTLIRIDDLLECAPYYDRTPEELPRFGHPTAEAWFDNIVASR